eukprot:Transcript_20277.p1 GENE.Transcript_20277~~Transcript_20277.p1  ORF type:complete len:341 (+),score=59.10 Transcript_20277:45-1067(+)
MLLLLCLAFSPPPHRCCGAALPLMGRCLGSTVMSSGSSEQWFPEGANEAEIKRRFRNLAATMHPDRADGAGGTDAVAQFQELTAEYIRLLDKCRTVDQREALRKGWLGLGGLYAAAAAALTAPAAAATAAGAVGSLAILSLAADYLTKGDKARLLEPEGGAEVPLTAEEAAAAEVEAARQRLEALRAMYRQERSSTDEEVEESALASRQAAAAKAAIAAVAEPGGTAADASASPPAAAVAPLHRSVATSPQLEHRAVPLLSEKAAATRASPSAPRELLGGTSPPMPAALADWGCDEVLWRQIDNKKYLRKLASNGDEVRGRARIARLRKLVSEEGTDGPI